MRAWFFQPFATVSGVRNWTIFDNTLAVAKAHNVKVIFVLANEWAYCDGAGRTTARDLIWYQGGYKTQVDSGSAVAYRAWVQEAVTRYKDDPTIAMWQLINEGAAGNADLTCSAAPAPVNALRAFADDVGGLIKSIDSNHLVSAGFSPGSCGTWMDEWKTAQAGASIDVLDYHDYDDPNTPIGGDANNVLQASINRAIALNKPIIVGELGIHTNAIVPATNAHRATLFDAKFAAQYAAGVQGELLWDWDETKNSDLDIIPGDPALALLSTY